MGKNKEDQEDDIVLRTNELVNLYSVLIGSPVDAEGKHSEGLDDVLAKLEEHILNLLNKLDFTTEEKED